MNRTLVNIVFGAIAVLVIDCGSIRAEESIFSRLNPIRLFQRAPTEVAPVAPGPQAYGTPGPAWHAGQQSGEQAGPPAFNGNATAHGGRLGPGGASSMPESARLRSESRGRQPAGTEGRPARSGDGRGGAMGSLRAGPAGGNGEDFEGRRFFGSFPNPGQGSNFSRAGGASRSFGPAGGGIGMSLEGGYRGR